jgi:GNAT superfamily N-acetyltransferase
VLREFFETTRLRGVRWAARTLRRRFLVSYRQAFLFRTPMVPEEASSPETPVSDALLEFRLASPEDLDRLGVFQPYVARSRMRRWLETENTWVFLALDGDRPVAFECHSTALPPDSVLPPIVLTKAQVWLIEMYVVPEYRRRHVSMGLRQYRRRLMRTWGFEEAFSKIDADNYASLKRMLSLLRESSRVRRVTCLCVFGLRWWWIEEDARPQLEEHLRRLERGGGERAG